MSYRGDIYSDDWSNVFIHFIESFTVYSTGFSVSTLYFLFLMSRDGIFKVIRER